MTFSSRILSTQQALKAAKLTFLYALLYKTEVKGVLKCSTTDVFPSYFDTNFITFTAKLFFKQHKQLQSKSFYFMNLIQGSIAVLNDAKFFLQRLNAADYAQPITIMSDSTIGQHTRHFIEFYQCLLQQAQTGTINYCLRKRDLNIEKNPSVAIAVIDSILLNLDKLNLESPVILHTSKEGGECIQSTLGRELHYNVEHCIHHLALIKIGLKIIIPAMPLPEHFGVAPSTIQHRNLIVQ